MQMDFQTLFLFMHSRVLGFLHLARRGAFLKTPLEAWTSKNFQKREGVAEWPLFCQVDTSTQTPKVRS